MPFEFRKEQVLLQGVVGVEDAETLLEWLQKHPNASADLSGCEHVHPANLQVLLGGATRFDPCPADAALARLLQTLPLPRVA